MKWNTNDVDVYLQEQEYIDTAVLSLLPVSFAEDKKSRLEQFEFAYTLSNEVEKQFKGRIVQFPSFTYHVSEEQEQAVERLQVWLDDLNTLGMKHIFLITSDSNWKGYEKTCEENVELVWVPSIPLAHLDGQVKHKIIQDQLNQLIPIMTKKWQNR
ncbi:YpiF family protein [Halalkalibacterium halodurans]|uniref:YpiF family protein n=1 Tax=Halalkalibacterium halodurans TaxID=86665 RepID=UPI00106849C9|nr:YpiF family protein [Halalkalibacterium halodurans]MED3646075.1 YpiF family protein [Halalkalibacterium halodurans]TES57750.1 DUF2487 family protein [Halalkalibacterium halodurans]